MQTQKMGAGDGLPEISRHSDTEVYGADRKAFSGPLNKRGTRKSARFNIPDDVSSASGSMNSRNNNEDYVEITLDVGDDTVAVHSVKTAGGADVEDQELTLLTRGLEKRASLGTTVVRNASARIRQVSEELRKLTSFQRRPTAGPYDRSKSAATHALKGLKFITKTDGAAQALEARFDELTKNTTGLLPRALFGECIGMNKDSKDFAGELFDALSRRRNITGDLINKEQLKEFWDQIVDQSFDSRLQTFFDMVDKDADGRISEDEVREIITLSASANKLSNIQKQADEYAALIMEELDPDNLGYIMGNMALRCRYRGTRGISGLLFVIVIISSMFLVCSPSSSFTTTPQQQQHNISSFDCTQGVTCHHDKSSKKADDASCLKRAFSMLDAGFFNDSKILEIKKGAEELNIPIMKANRKAVATTNGGLHYHSPLVFHSKWKHEEAQDDTKRFSYPSVTDVTRPKNEEDIAFMTILELGHLIRTKQVSSVELVEIFLKRLKRYNPVLEAVITITEDLAHKQAEQADQLLAQGVDLGPLHGIPYGLKDIISVPEYKTTWGSTTFKNQVLDSEAWVYKRLKFAGAVLVGKLVTGSLAYDDIWFGGRTRNPWNIEEFTTGSSAGPAACTSAGLVPFAIGSETAGSITYPAARCGVTVLRPTFGAVGRTGVLSLSESLDKLGPLCRSAVDCAIVLDLIRGKDPDDMASRKIFVDDPFSVDITKLTVGYLEDAEMEVVDVLKSKGVKMVPFKLNYTVESAQGILNFTMDVDMLAHFDNWQRSGKDDEFEAQDQWPTELRRARIIPAVDYVQSQRARGKLIQEIRDSFTVDAFVGNVTDWEKVCVGNLVGMPVMVVPVGYKKIPDPPTNDTRRKTTVTTGIYAPPDHDHIALALTMAYQSVTNHHKQRPPIDDLGPDDAIPNPPKAMIAPRILKG